MSGEAPVPIALAQEVDQYVYEELADATKYTNRAPLDDSGVWALHRLVASAYARGFSDGCVVQGERDRGRRQRERDAARVAEAGDQ